MRMYMCMIYQFLICFLCDVFILLTRVPVKCETKRETKYTETKPNQTKRNAIHRNETKFTQKRNEIDAKRNKSKWNWPKGNETV
jgi:hypothetical protein